MNEEIQQTANVNTPTPAPVMEVTKPSLIKELATPVAIVIAGIFVGAGLYFSGGSSGDTARVAVEAEPTAPADTTEKVEPITEADYVKGDPNAPIKIIEYSDFDCPFCTRFHATMETVFEESDGEIAWVYRHFPLEQLHPNARAIARASECVGELGGTEAFWTFTDGYFAAGDRKDPSTLVPKLVLESGVTQEDFTACFESGRHDDAIQADLENAVETGGRGTPWSILVGPTGKTYPINGAQTPQVVRQIIQIALDEA